MKLRMLVALAAVVLAVAACGGRWQVEVYNNTGTAVGVRLNVDGDARTWLFQPDQQDVIAQESRRHAGTVELFDPVSCNVLATEELPDGDSVHVLLGQGFAAEGDGAWTIDAAVEDGSDSALLDPNFNDCA